MLKCALFHERTSNLVNEAERSQHGRDRETLLSSLLRVD